MKQTIEQATNKRFCVLDAAWVKVLYAQSRRKAMQRRYSPHSKGRQHYFVVEVQGEIMLNCYKLVMAAL